MKKFLFLIIAVLLLSLIFPWSATAEIEWHVERTIKFEKKPIDTCMSPKGTYLFALTNDGIIHAYDPDGNVKGEMFVGKQIDNIACGPEENMLVLKSKKEKEVQTIVFDFVEVINTEGSPFKGNADAPVVIVVFTDYQCPYCARLSATLDQVIEKNKDTVKIVTKNFPLPMHKYARDAAAAALAAYKMGKFREYNDELYKNSRQLNDEKLLEIATDLGLDPDKFEQKKKSKEIRDKIDQDVSEAKKAGATGTPTVFVNGRKLRNRSLDGFQDMIDSLLKK